MTEDQRKAPSQSSLEAEFEHAREAPEAEKDAPAQGERAPAGIDSVPLIHESSSFPEEAEPPADAPPPTAGDGAPPEQLDLAEPPESSVASEDEAEIEPAAAAPAVEESEAAPGVAGRFARQWLLAGLADLGLHLVIVVVAAFAAVLLDLPVHVGQWPGFLAFALAFSFLYTALPLAFWGQTPGMSLCGLRALDGSRQLSFGQTLVRWVAALLTVALAGLPLLLARSGRPLADRLSRSQTYVWDEA